MCVEYHHPCENDTDISIWVHVRFWWAFSFSAVAADVRRRKGLSEFNDHMADTLLQNFHLFLIRTIGFEENQKD